MFFRLCRVLLAALVTLGTTTGFAELLPIEAYSQLPLVAELRLSPNGKRIAYLANAGDATVLMIKDTLSGQETPVTKTDNKVSQFDWVNWIGDERVLFGSTNPIQSWLFLVDLKSPERVERIDIWGYSRVHLLPDDNEHVLVSIYDKNGYAMVYRVSLTSGKSQLFQPVMKPVRGWMLDQQGRVRLGRRSRRRCVADDAGRPR